MGQQAANEGGWLTCMLLQHRREEGIAYSVNVVSGDKPSAAIAKRANGLVPMRRGAALHQVIHFMVGMMNSALWFRRDSVRSTVIVLVLEAPGSGP